MGRAPCCDKANVKKGPWSPEEDAKLKEFIEKFGTGGNWIALPQKAGLKRCGKSCRLRWLNYLRPNIKHGEFSDEEDRMICSLYASIGSRWSIIAAQLPGRTDNDIKNYWNTKLKKKLMGMMIPLDQRKLAPFSSNSTQLSQSFSTTSLSQLYRDCNSPYNYTPNSTKSLMTIGLEAFTLQPNLLYNNNIIPNNHSYLLQSQDSLINPMHFCNPGKDNNNNNSNMLVFGGGTEASCSSSDGSCSQISYGKEMKQDHMNNNGLQGYNISSGYDHQENQKFVLDHYVNNYGGGAWNNDNDQKPNVFSANNQLQYDLDEVKQLISSNNTSFFINDENKAHEREMMYDYY